MLRKLIVVYNPRSSRAKAVEREVLGPSRKLEGWLVGKYQVKPTDVDDNARELAKILNDGDLVISAGGDGTAVIAVNGVMLSEKDVVLGVLGYGNFNDMARMLRMKRAVEYGGEYIGGVTEIVQRFTEGKTKEVHPLEVKVNGEHWRYVPCYVTLGLLAESVAVFDDKKVRKKLQTGKKGLIFSVWNLAKWYFENRKREFLPKGKLERKNARGSEVEIKGVAQTFSEGATDYMAINGSSVARIMRGGKNYRKKEAFRSNVSKLSGVGGLMWFMMRSVLVRVPGKKTVRDVIKFDEPSEVEIQAEGEYQKLKEVKEIVVEKTKVLKVVGK